jgi:competence protein ComEC
MAEGSAREIANERSLLGADDVVIPEREGKHAGLGTGNPVQPGRSRFGAGDLIPAIKAALVLEWERGTAFLLIPVFLAVGIVAYYSLPTEPSLSAVAVGAAMLSLAGFLARARPAIHLSLLALVLVVAGMFFAALETWRAGTKVLGGEISTSITGRVAVIEHQANGRVRLTLDVLDTARPKLRYAPDRVRVSARSIPADLAAGTVVTGIVRLFPPSGPLRPGSYDFSFESYFDGIGANGFFLRDPIPAEREVAASIRDRFDAEVENARTALAQRIRAWIGGPEGEIAAALIAGTRAGIPEEVNEALRRTGLAHVLSISGLHMALVAWTIMTALRLGLALFPGFASRRPVKKYAASVALIATGVYLFISGSAVAAERSFIMLAVMLVAVLFDRAALTMRNLAIAATAILVVSPHEVVGPSFQMSFAATAALIGVYAWWSERKPRVASPAQRTDGSLPMRLFTNGIRYVGGIAAVSIIAGMATTIYGAYHFQRVSPLSLGANLAAMPIVSVLVMPFAVAAMAAMPLGFDGPFLDVMGWGLAMMIAVADWFSRHSPLDAVGTVPIASVLAMTVALLIATLATTWLRMLALPFVVASLVMLFFRSTPEVLVSEDARLMAVTLSDGRLAVNRPRPNGFTIDDWARATLAETLAKPLQNKAADAEPAENTEVRDQQLPAVESRAPVIPLGDLTEKEGFFCDAGLCVLRHRSGKLVLHASNASLVAPFCQEAVLIIIDDATAENPCPAKTVAVLTKRHLARRGAATIDRLEGEGPAGVNFSLTEPYRPWHHHRQFSREARGIAPFKPKTREAQAAE